MSISVDDLVSSLSSNHIGQEAMDLAILQTQLAETLFSGSTTSTSNNANCGVKSSFPSRGRKRNAQPCTTPTARTPSVSSNSGWSMAMDTNRSRRNSVSSIYLDDMEEDEQMVEDLLIPSPPLSASLSSSHFGGVFLPSTFQETQPSPTHTNSGMFNTGYTSQNSFTEPPPSSPTVSLFATTDPFYLAQLQSLNNVTSHPQSVFAQNALLAQNSPFARPQYEPLHAQNQNAGMVANHSSMPFSAF